MKSAFGRKRTFAPRSARKSQARRRPRFPSIGRCARACCGRRIAGRLEGSGLHCVSDILAFRRAETALRAQAFPGANWRGFVCSGKKILAHAQASVGKLNPAEPRPGFGNPADSADDAFIECGALPSGTRDPCRVQPHGRSWCDGHVYSPWLGCAMRRLGELLS